MAAGDAGLVGHGLELRAMVEGQGQHLRTVLRAVGGPVDLLELFVFSQRMFIGAVLEEVVELGPRRDGRGAAVAGDGEGAAGIGVLAAGLQRLVA